MNNSYINALVLLVIPAIVFLGGASIIGNIVERSYVIDQLQKAEHAEDRKPLNRRLNGYKLADVKRQWGLLDEKGLIVEQHFLEVDLVFPFFYGAALLGTLLVAWISIGRPFAPVFILLPVAITVLADWTENLVLLRQLGSYIKSRTDSLDPAWIQVASSATICKLLFFIGSAIYLLVLVGRMVAHAATTTS